MLREKAVKIRTWLTILNTLPSCRTQIETPNLSCGCFPDVAPSPSPECCHHQHPHQWHVAEMLQQAGCQLPFWSLLLPLRDEITRNTVINRALLKTPLPSSSLFSLFGGLCR